VAQVYATEFPDDVKTLLLDSPISDIRDYYTYNTANYVSSLNKLFESCKNDPGCNGEYPDLEDTYYKVVEDLTQNPITVEIDESIVETGTFTYNAEDFKIAIHQALYQNGLIEVLPLLIDQFHSRNKEALGALVAAFSSALGLDYGMYYCVSCTETISNNQMVEYTQNANQFPKLNGGLSFYNSDFAVCDKWNENILNESEEAYEISTIDKPTLIFTGKFDPITPWENGDSLVAQIENSTLLKADNFGHASSFTWKGFEVSNKFVNDPTGQLDKEDFAKFASVNFAKDIHVNGGVAKLGDSISNFDIFFFAPLIIALLILLVAIFVYTIGLIRKRKVKDLRQKILKLLLIISSILGLVVLVGLVLALNSTASINFYILAVGIPENWSYLFTLLLIFFAFVILSLIYFLISINKLDNRSVIFSVLFSNILLGVYFLYWGFV